MFDEILNVLFLKGEKIGCPLKNSNSSAYDFIKLHTRSSINANIVIMVMDNFNKKPIAIVKIPRSIKNTSRIINENRILEVINERLSKCCIKRKIPCRTIVEKVHDTNLLFQEFKSGKKMVYIMNSPKKIKILYPIIFDWLFCFYKKMISRKCCDTTEVNSQVKKIIMTVKSLYPAEFGKMSPKSLNYFDSLYNYKSCIPIPLLGQHCDFNAHNIVFENFSKKKSEFYVLDWEDYLDASLPIIDINHFFVSNSKLLSTRNDTFENFLLYDGFYQKMYINTVEKYCKEFEIDIGWYWKLTPIYFLIMCMRISENNRNQESMLYVWLDRVDKFINYFSGFEY